MSGMALCGWPCLWSDRQQATIGTRRPAWVVEPDHSRGAHMPMPRSARAMLVAATALLLIVPTAAVAKEGHGRGHGHGGHDDLPMSYFLGPAEAAIFPEGITARGDTFYVGSTADGTI